jgi:hypothetical protein
MGLSLLAALFGRQHHAGIVRKSNQPDEACQSNIHRSVSAIVAVCEYAAGTVRDMASSTSLSLRLAQL